MIKTDFSTGLTASIDIQVPFFDIDPGGVAWHGHYFKYFEVARCELLEGVGYSYERMMETGLLWPIADTMVRYVHPLTLNKKARVTACLREWEFRLVIDYKVEDEAGKILTRGRTVQVPVEAESLELRLGSPQELIDKVQAKLRETGLAAD